MYSLKVITGNDYLTEGNIPYTACTVPGASFSLVSFCVIVSVDEDCVMCRSCLVCSLSNLPMVELSSVSVIKASSGLMAMYGLTRLLSFFCLILLI